MLTDLHALKNISIICVSLFFLWLFSISIYLAYLQRDVFLQRGKKCSPVLKSCCQDPDIGEDLFLSSLHYFPEQTVISSIFHAYGHECLPLPHLNVNKKAISWLQFSFEDKEDMKTSLEIWCVSCSHLLSFAFSFLHVDANGRHCSPPAHPLAQSLLVTRRSKPFQKPVFVIPTHGGAYRVWTLLSFQYQRNSHLWGNLGSIYNRFISLCIS